MVKSLLSRDLAAQSKSTGSLALSNPRGNTDPQVREAGKSRVGAEPAPWAWRRGQLRGGGAGVRRGFGRGSQDLLIAGVTGLTGLGVLRRVRMLRALGRALGGGDQSPLLQFPVSVGFGGSCWCVSRVSAWRGAGPAGDCPVEGEGPYFSTWTALLSR